MWTYLAWSLFFSFENTDKQIGSVKKLSPILQYSTCNEFFTGSSNQLGSHVYVFPFCSVVLIPKGKKAHLYISALNSTKVQGVGIPPSNKHPPLQSSQVQPEHTPWPINSTPEFSPPSA